MESALRLTGTLDPRFFPAPSTIVSSAWQLLGSPPDRAELLDDITITLWRVAIGFALAARIRR